MAHVDLGQAILMRLVPRKRSWLQVTIIICGMETDNDRYGHGALNNNHRPS